MRLRAYQEEILIDAGRQPAREYPALPEEQVLAEMMKQARGLKPEPARG